MAHHEQVAAVTETANTITEMAQTSAVTADRASELIRQGEAVPPWSRTGDPRPSPRSRP